MAISASFNPATGVLTVTGDTSQQHDGGETRRRGHVIAGDVNGDGRVDFKIEVHSAAALQATDFIL